MVVIDCGHGGRDPGAVGVDGILEKDICLSLGLRLADTLKASGYAVFMTRSDDTHVPLDVRTTTVNNLSGVDLLISLHANALPHLKARGIETFCLKKNLITLAYTDCVSDELTVYTGLSKKLYKQSEESAHAVQHAMINSLRKQYAVIDRGVRHKVAQVLLGVSVPSVLIEVGFVSDKEEANNLISTEYQQQLVAGIVQGVQQIY